MWGSSVCDSSPRPQAEVRVSAPRLRQSAESCSSDLVCTEVKAPVLAYVLYGIGGAGILGSAIWITWILVRAFKAMHAAGWASVWARTARGGEDGEREGEKARERHHTSHAHTHGERECVCE